MTDVGISQHVDNITRISLDQMATEEPVGLLGGVKQGFASANAGNAFRYHYEITELDTANQKRLRQAGFEPKPMFELVSPWGGLGGAYGGQTEFQDIVAINSDIMGPDDRYQARTSYQKSIRDAFAENRQMIEKAKAARPDLGIQSYDEMHQQVLSHIASQRFVDPRMGFWGDVGAFVGGMANMGNLATNPWAPVELLSMAFGGVGPNVASRVASLAAVNAAMAVAPQIEGRKALEQAGVPLTNEDLAWSAAYGGVAGVLGGLLGEALIGSVGRAHLNDRYSFITLSDRQRKFEKLMARSKAPEPEAPPPPEPPPPPPAPLVKYRGGVADEIGAQFRQEPTVFHSDFGALDPPTAKDRALMTVLDLHATTKAEAVRLAKDLDHAATQMEVTGIAPQDMIAVGTRLEANATGEPSVRTYLGAGVHNVPELPPAWRRAAKGVESNAVLETLAKKLDPETFIKWDKTKKALAEAQQDLADVSAFHEAAAARKTDVLAKRVDELQNKIDRQKSDAAKAETYAEIEALTKYHNEIASVRGGGFRPTPLKGFDEFALAERVAMLTAKRDEIFASVERAVARAEGLWGLPSAQREALEDELRPGAVNRISSSWRWPKGHKRPKGAKKNNYEVKLLKGPTQEEVFAERKLQLEQEADVFANVGRKANETPAETATRVNELRLEPLEKEAAAFIANVKDFIGSLEAVSKKQPTGIAPTVKAGAGVIPKGTVMSGTTGSYIVGFNTAGGGKVKLLDDSIVSVTKYGNDIMDGRDIIDPSAVKAFIEPGDKDWTQVIQPMRMPAGMSMADLQAVTKQMGGFEVNGKSASIEDALNDLLGDAEASLAISTCSVRP
jgi:hypothetical protein